MPGQINNSGGESNVLKILFGVLGGSEISGESGARIKGELDKIVKTLNDDVNGYKIKISLNKETLTKEINEIKDALSELDDVSKKEKKDTKTSENAKKINKEYSESIRLINELEKAKTKGRHAFAEADAAALQSVKNDQLSQKQKIELQKKYMDVLTKMSSSELDTLERMQIKYDSLIAKGKNTVSRGFKLTTLNEDDKAQLEDLDKLLAKGLDTTSIQTAKKDIDELRSKIVQVEASTTKVETGFQRLGRAIRNKFTQIVSVALIGAATRALHQVYKNVVEIDSAMTELEIVTRETKETYSQFIDQATTGAKKLGVAITDLIRSSVTFSRLGYTSLEAEKFAELTAMYSMAGAVDVNEATKNITAIIKAYDVGVDNLESILDKIVYVDQRYAISSAELGEGMNNAASSLAANGNTFEESLAILTSAHITLQNVSKSSTAVRTIAARLSASKAQLEELGESTDGVFATANLDKEIRALTNGAARIVDYNGELRSTYDILGDMARVWDKLNSTQKASIAGLVAGTRQQNAFYSIMQNWEETQGAVVGYGEATGTLQKAQELYLESIEGKVKQLEAAWQSVSFNILNSGIVKALVGWLSMVISAFDELTSTTVNKVAVAASAILAIIMLFGKQIKSLFTKFKTQTVGGIIIVAVITLLSWLDTLGTKGANVAQILIASLGAIGIAVTMLIRQIAAAISGAKAAIPWLAIIQAVLGVIIFLIQGISGLIKKNLNAQNDLKQAAENTAKALNEEADAMKNVAENANQSANSIKELIDQFEKLSRQSQNKDWLKTITNVDTEAAKLYPDQALGTFEAINNLLGIQYNLKNLLAMKDAERLELLENIEKTSARLARNQQDQAYRAVKNSAESDLIAYGLGSINYKDEWGEVAKDSVKRYNREADVLLSKLGFQTSLKGSDKQIDITLEADSARDFEDKIDKAIEAYDARYINYKGELKNNAVYQWLKDNKDKVTQLLNKEKEAALNYAKSAINDESLRIDIDENSDNIVEEYESAINKIFERIKSDESIKDALSDGNKYLTEDILRNSIGKSLSENYSIFDGFETRVDDVSVTLKTFLEIADEVQGKYDVLQKALDEFNTYGVVQVDTIKDITSNYPELIEQLILTEQGYVVNTNVLEKYIEAKRKEYSAIAEITEARLREAKAKQDENPNEENILAVIRATKDYEAALYNLYNLEAYFETVNRTKGSTEKDRLNKQLDSYEELIDIRKKLLQSYESELKYQKELEKKQRTVASLQSSLAIARMDKSASGQARVRELEEELKQAQESLEEYTLEHAIKEIIDQLDTEYKMQKSFIEEQIKKITDAIGGIAPSIATIISQKIIDAGGTGGAGGGSGGTGGAGGGSGGAGGSGSGNEDYKYNPDIGGGNDDDDNNVPIYSPGDLGIAFGSTPNKMSKKQDRTGDYFNAWIGGVKHDALVDSFWTTPEKTAELFGLLPPGGITVMDNQVIMRSGGKGESLYELKGTNVAGLLTKEKQAAFVAAVKTLPPPPKKYHTGGFVGNESLLQSNEEFAKLLKGEFVATPKQMSTFMERTLPSIATSNKSVQYNAPLVAITCGSVTKETLPELEKVVQNAVNTIKKDIDSSFSRTGRSRSINKFSI